MIVQKQTPTEIIVGIRDGLQNVFQKGIAWCVSSEEV